MARFTHIALSLLAVHTLTTATGCALVVEPRYLRAVPEAGTTEGMDVVFGSDAVTPDGRGTDDVSTVESDVVVTFDVPTERTDVSTSFDVPTRADVPTARDVPTVLPDVPNERPDTYGDAPNACAAGFTRCLGFCVNTQTNSMHCGVCNSPCVGLANQNANCVGGVCNRMCVAGSADCDGIVANGCETNTNTNSAHCGRCNNGCGVPANFNGVPVCSMGSCTFACTPGFANCDGVALNGCESELAVDPRNCGACGTSCQAQVGQVAACAGGMCRSCGLGQIFCPHPRGMAPACCTPMVMPFDCNAPGGAVCSAIN